MNEIQTAYKKGIAYNFTASDIQKTITEAKEFNDGKTFKESAANGNSSVFAVRFQSKDEYTGIIFKNNQFKEIKTKDKIVLFNRLNKIPVKAYPNLYGKTAAPTGRDLHEDMRNTDMYKKADIVKKLYLELTVDNKTYNMVYGLNGKKQPILVVTLRVASMDRLVLLVSSDSEVLIHYDKHKGYTVYPDGREKVAKEIIKINEESLNRFKKQRNEIKKIINMKDRLLA